MGSSNASGDPGEGKSSDSKKSSKGKTKGKGKSVQKSSSKSQSGSSNKGISSSNAQEPVASGPSPPDLFSFNGPGDDFSASYP
ncbi:hypothetical protein AB5N19_03058 [Seiridium cardinale]